MKKRYLSILFIFAIILFGCSSNKEKYSESFFSFDTHIQLDAYASDKKEYEEYFKLAQTEFKKYHEMFDAYNNYKNINNVKTINDNAGKKAVKVDSEVYNVLKDSKELYSKLHGYNNIALAPVVLEYKKVLEDYNEGKNVSHPDQDLLKEKAKCTSMDNLVLKANNEVYLKKECSKLDVGSIAKGYAADAVSQKLKKAGLESGILNAGGNVVVIGEKAGGEPFKVGIANPNSPNNYIAIVNAKNTNIVTSGDYQRYYEIDGVKYNHIINPKTLKPADMYKSVTIITDSGFEADYLSTECFMLDLATVEKLAKEYNFEYIMIDKNDKISISDGIKDEVTIK